MEASNQDLVEAKTKMSEVIGEHKSLLLYFKYNDQMRVHLIVCDNCMKGKDCRAGRSMAQDVTKLHMVLQKYFSDKEKSHRTLTT